MLTLPTLRCERCGHRWIPRKSERPESCPHCKSRIWDKPREPDVAVSQR
jgi:DNA-directed RNA polymerase subunit RPC12/RpoP